MIFAYKEAKKYQGRNLWLMAWQALKLLLQRVKTNVEEADS